MHHGQYKVDDISFPPKASPETPGTVPAHPHSHGRNEYQLSEVTVPLRVQFHSFMDRLSAATGVGRDLHEDVLDADTRVSPDLGKCDRFRVLAVN